METCDIRIEPGMISRGQQTDIPASQSDHSDKEDADQDDADGISRNYLSEKLIDSIINPTLT